MAEDRGVRAEAPGRDRSYLRMLMLLVGTATFFDGYDSAIASVALSDIGKSFDVTSSELGGSLAVAYSGGFASLFVIAVADKVGRRPLLIVTTMLYAAFTGLTAISTSLETFTLFQFLARIFLSAELVTAVIVVAEEFPAERRGAALGTLTALAGLGAGAVGLSYRFFSEVGLSWRSLYLVGVIPLLLVGLLRLRLRETDRWERSRAPMGGRVPYRVLFQAANLRRLFMIGAILFLFRFSIQGTVVWWSYYARNERGLAPSTVGNFFVVIALAGALGYYTGGRLQDRLGRRPIGMSFMLLGVAGLAASYQMDAPAMVVMAALGLFLVWGAHPVVAAISSELFRTEVRATAGAVTASLFGVGGAMLSPYVLGRIADPDGLVGSLHASVPIVSLAVIPAAIIVRLLPETARRELEEVTGDVSLPTAVSQLAERKDR